MHLAPAARLQHVSSQIARTLRSAVRRTSALALTAACALAATSTFAQTAYPTKGIRILVGAPAGGSNDIFARAIGQRVSESFKQPVVVDNRPGASQMIAAELMAKSPPDGHVLYVSSSTYTTTAGMRPKLAFDPVADVLGITMLGKGPMVLVVHPSLPAKSVKELLALIRARPGQLNYTSSGIGSINHMATEMFRIAAKIDIVHIPQKGMSPAITDLIGGQVQLLIVSLPSVEAQIKSGRLRALGVTSAKRSALVPQMPTVAESGLPGYEAELWWGLFAPAKTPTPVVEKLNAEVRAILATEEMKKRFGEFGAEPAPMSPEAFTALIKSEITRWADIVTTAHIKAE